MPIPTNNSEGVCLRLFMSDLHKAALEKSEGRTACVLAIVPRANQPFGATHAVYQLVHGSKDHKVVGHARFYRDAVPQELQTDLPL